MNLKLIWVVTVIFVLSACHHAPPISNASFTAFGTNVELNLINTQPAQLRQIIATIEQDFYYIEQEVSTVPNLPLTRVNQLLSAQRPFVTSPLLLHLITISKIFYTRSHGLFNPARGRLNELWGLQENRVGSQKQPTVQQITQLIQANPTMDQIECTGLMIQGHNSALKLDLQMIARAYALQLAAERIRENKIRHALMRLGNAVWALGNQAGHPWRIPLRDNNGASVVAILPLHSNENLVTLSTADRNFLFAGVLYPTILDPRTGWPVTETSAVTVVHPDPIIAAIAAQALFIAGPRGWQAIAQELEVKDVLLIDTHGQKQITPTLAARLESVEPSENPDGVGAKSLKNN